MKLKSKWPVRRFFAFLGALYLFCAVTPLLFAESGTTKSESGFSHLRHGNRDGPHRERSGFSLRGAAV